MFMENMEIKNIEKEQCFVLPELSGFFSRKSCLFLFLLD